MPNHSELAGRTMEEYKRLIAENFHLDREHEADSITIVFGEHKIVEDRFSDPIEESLNRSYLNQLEQAAHELRYQFKVNSRISLDRNGSVRKIVYEAVITKQPGENQDA